MACTVRRFSFSGSWLELAADLSAQIANTPAASPFRNLAGRHRIRAPQSPDRNGENFGRNGVRNDRVGRKAIKLG
jgi:hypothetical protein